MGREDEEMMRVFRGAGKMCVIENQHPMSERGVARHDRA